MWNMAYWAKVYTKQGSRRVMAYTKTVDTKPEYCVRHGYGEFFMYCGELCCPDCYSDVLLGLKDDEADEIASELESRPTFAMNDARVNPAE